MTVILRIHSRASSSRAFLFRRHTVFTLHGRFSQITLFTRRLQPFRDKSSRFSGHVWQISYLLIPFEDLKLCLQQVFLLNVVLFFSLIVSISNDHVLRNFKYKWQNFNESIFIDLYIGDLFLTLTLSLLVTFPKKIVRNVQKEQVYICTENLLSQLFNFQVMTHFVPEKRFF